MSPHLRRELREQLVGSPLLELFDARAAAFLERAGTAFEAIRDNPMLLKGLARLLASSAQAARNLAYRQELWPRLVSLQPNSLSERSTELLHVASQDEKCDDLESFLDELRLLRRGETLLAAAADFVEMIPFEEISTFLSVLAESIVQRALHAAHQRSAATPPLAAIGMGKIGGREFTYHSDLDLVLLYQGDSDAVWEVSRVGQRLIAYLSTMTGAGVAYAVDSRLRPSGQQGTLVTSFSAFEKYQLGRAQTWEHMALVRARPIAGDTARAEHVLESVLRAVGHSTDSPWPYISTMRRRVEAERAQEKGGRIAFKTGAGGMMDIDFLAAGACLEKGLRHGARPDFPSAPALLRAAGEGPRLEALLESYRTLRLVESRVRWVSDRAVDTLDPHSDAFPLVAALMPGELSPAALLDAIARARTHIRSAYDAAISTGSISALEERGRS